MLRVFFLRILSQVHFSGRVVVCVMEDQKPPMAGNGSQGDAKTLGRLKTSRKGKKTSITTRNTRIGNFVKEGGSRKLIGRLLKDLRTTYTELEQVCNDISEIIHDVDEYNCIEQYRADIELCEALVDDYFESRRGDPSSSSSSASLTSTWLRKHADILESQREALSETTAATDDESLEQNTTRIENQTPEVVSVTAQLTNLSLRSGMIAEEAGNKLEQCEGEEPKGEIVFNPFDRSISPNYNLNNISSDDHELSKDNRSNLSWDSLGVPEFDPARTPQGAGSSTPIHLDISGRELLGDMSDIIAVENNGMESEIHTNEMEVMSEDGETMIETTLFP